MKFSPNMAKNMSAVDHEIFKSVVVVYHVYNCGMYTTKLWLLVWLLLKTY